MQQSLPVIFFGHGNPMNSIRRNRWTDAWAAVGAQLPRPKAVLCLSAHWYLPSTRITAMPFPRTIHDFGGFPPEVFAVEYPAPGDPELAGRIQSLLAPLPVELDLDWGLDHGTWSVLRHVFPDADVAVLQLSLDSSQPPAFHYALGQKLEPLRDEGVLVVGSGNIVHNLREYAWHQPSARAFDWALRFEAWVRACLSAGENSALIAYESLGPDAARAVPTPEHYLPLLCVAGMRRAGDALSFPAEGFDGGSIGMLSVQFG
jgi:4,5-DOPA dioxygenase extradiol